MGATGAGPTRGTDRAGAIRSSTREGQRIRQMSASTGHRDSCSRRTQRGRNCGGDATQAVASDTSETNQRDTGECDDTDYPVREGQRGRPVADVSVSVTQLQKCDSNNNILNILLPYFLIATSYETFSFNQKLHSVHRFSLWFNNLQNTKCGNLLSRLTVKSLSLPMPGVELLQISI